MSVITGSDQSAARPAEAAEVVSATSGGDDTKQRRWTLPSKVRAPLGVIATWVGRVTGLVTRLGWTVLVVAVAAWFVGWWAGWYEFMVISLTAAALLVLAVPFLFGRAFVRVLIDLAPDRVTVGARAMGRLNATNTSRLRLLPLRLELPLGRAVASFDLPSLAPGSEHEELFVVPTRRRAVIPVGPAAAVRGDPLGLLRREVHTGPARELIVHPEVVRLDTLGGGFLRDLEGQTTNHLSSSDVAFHTLRDYVPGDDRRFVHWRTSARTGKLMVRQFVDTRRSHAAVVLDLEPAAYGEATEPGAVSGDEFELAVSAATSFGLRVLRDEQTLTVVTGAGRVPSASGRMLLDGMARVEPSTGHGLRTTAVQLDRSAPDASIVLVFTGSRATLGDLRRSVQGVSSDTRVISVRCRLGGGSAFREVVGLTMLELSDLHDLARLLRTAVY